MNENKVEYLLVGGYAVAIHGFPRYTKDFDFWVNPSKQNAKKVYKTMIDFGLEFLEFTIEDFRNKDKIFYFGNPPNRVDLLTSIESLEFDEVYKARKEVIYDDVKINVISEEFLIKNKLSTGRSKDLMDAEELKKIIAKKTK